MDLMKGLRERPRLRKILIGSLIFLFLFTTVGFFAVPPILKSVLTRKLSEKLQREVTIRQIKVNPFVLSAEIKGFAVKKRDKSGAFVSFDDLFMNLQIASVWKRGPILKELRIDRPYINIIRNEDGTYNFSDLLEEGKPKTTSEAKPLRFSLNNIQIVNGSLDFLDGPKHTRHKARDVIIKIPFISDLPHYVDTFVQPMFEAELNGTKVSFKGKTKPFTDSLETSLDVNVKDFNIPYYLAYVPFKMNFKLLSGYVDTGVRITYTQYKNKVPTLTLSGDIAVKQVKAADENDNRMISLPMINVSVASSDLIAGNLHLSKVFFESPEIDVLRDKTGKMNLASLVPQAAAGKKGDTKVMTIEADEMKVAGGRVSFSDSLKAEPFRTTLENIDLTIGHFSSRPNKKTALRLSFQTEAKEALKLDGDFTFDPVAAEGNMEIKGIPIRKYSPYFSEEVLFDVEGAQLDLQTRYSFSKAGEEPEIRLSGLAADLSSLMLKKRGEKDIFLKIPVVSVKEAEADLSKKELVVGNFSTKKGLLLIKRFSDGRVNIKDLIPPAPAGEAGIEGVKKGQAEKPWQILVKDFALEGYTVKVEDMVTSQPVATTVEKIRVAGKNIATTKNSKGKLTASLVLNRKGSVSTSGSIEVDPPSANLKLRIKGIELMPFQPYFADRLNIIVTGGSIALAGAVSAGRAGDGTVKASFKGESALTGFASVDAANGDDFLKWDALNLDGIRAGYAPLRLGIEKVALTDFYSRLVINKDGSLNLQQILKEQKGEANPSEAASEKSGAAARKAPDTVFAGSTAPPPRSSSAGPKPRPQKPGKLITIEAVTLQGGTINFTDRHIEPNYTANLLEIGGRVSGLSSEENKFADVDLKGKLENYAPLEITGRINPLRDDLFVDLKADFKDMDLSPVSPYSAKYAGYTIQKGRLALKLKYLIVKKKLDAQNNILLDQFTFGDKVESPDATKLPVKFAVALLKNRKGEINLDIPVSGNIDDPQFSLGRIILKIIVNLLVKAATSPFKLLGALFGHGDELSYVQFEYGHDDLGQPEMKKLDALIKALSDRPALKLEIEGYVDKEKDREALKQYLFEKKIKAQKLKEMTKKGEPAVPVDEVRIGKDEYAKYLKMAYKAEKFPKPRNFLGIAKNLPVPEMEKLMLTNLKVGDDDLRQLASQRSLRVKEYVIKSGQVTPDRVFLLEPKSLEPEKKEDLRDSRVDFKLK